MAYNKQTWDTTSYVNPTRMNHIEDGIESASTATGTEYSSGVSVKDKIEAVDSRTQLYFKDITTTTDNYGHIQLGSIYNLSVWAITNMFIIAPNNFHCIFYTYNAIPYIEVRDLSNTRQPNTEVKIRIVGYINVPIEAT